MITIFILGLDQFVVGHYSGEHTENLANLYETDESNINFYAPNAMVFHKGVEQTSWNTIVIVRAPKACAVLEKTVASYLRKTLSDFSVNLQIEFEYYEESHRHEFLNGAYPRYIEGDNLRYEDESEAPEEEECHCHEHEHVHPEEGDGDDQIFLGNAFAGIDEK